MVDTSSLQCCGGEITLAQEQSYAAEHWLDEKSTIEEVLVISTRYDQRDFPVPSVILLTYPHFWRTDMIDHPLASEKD